MDKTETYIGDIGHTKHKTRQNKAIQKTKQNKKKPHNKPPTHNTTLKRCATRKPQKTRDEPRCSRRFPTSQITLSKRCDNVTFSLLQRNNFTF